MPLLLCKQTFYFNGCNISKFHRYNNKACLSTNVQGAVPSQGKTANKLASQNANHFRF